VRRKVAVPKETKAGPNHRKVRALFVILPVALAIAIVTTLGAALPFLPPDRAASYVAVFAPVGAAGCVCGQPRTIVTAERPEEGLVAFGVNTYPLPHEFCDRIESLPAIKAAVPFLQYRFHDPADGHLFTIGGVDPRDTLIRNTKRGAATGAADLFSSKQNRNRVLVDRAYAQARHMKAGDRLGIGGKPFIVSGIVDPGTQPTIADIYLPYAQAERMIGDRLPFVPLAGQANVILAEIKNGTTREEAVQEIEALFPDLIVIRLESASGLTGNF
jgi:hypothetical protein